MTKGFMKGVATMLGIAILAGGVCAAGYASRNSDGKWFKNSDLASWHWSDKTKPTDTTAETWGGIIDNVGNELNAETTYAMPAAMTFYTKTPAPLAEQLGMSAPSVTVTCSHNFEFNNVLVDWSVEYPSGASAADVVTVTPTGDGSLTANVSCTSSFDTQLTLKATLRGHADKTATCTIDYVKRISSIDEIFLNGSDFDEDSGINFEPEFGLGSVIGSLKLNNSIYTLTDDFESEVKSYLKFDIKFKSHTASNKLLNLYSPTSKLYQYEGENFNYGMFIENFDNLDEAHKNAIYYAWNAAYLNGTDRKQKRSSIWITTTIDVLYNGVVVQSFKVDDYDLRGNNFNSLSGDSYGYDIAPDLTLNGNIGL